ncbi:hypothetical protein ES703_76699 [subsurface metagenome]
MNGNDRIVVRNHVEPMLEKLASLEREVSSEKGDFSLFAVFFREDAQDMWDLLVSAPWLEADKKEGLRYLVGELQARLDAREQLSLSRAVILEEDNPVLLSLQRMVTIRHGRAEVRDTNFSGLQIRPLARLERFLGIPTAKIEMRPESVGRWKRDGGRLYADFLAEELREHGYEVPPT